MELTMMSLGGFFALLTMIGMILSEFHSFNQHHPNILFSVRTKLWKAELGFDFTSSFFLQCLYKGESGDPNSPDIGFLKGPLLHVSTLCSICLFEN